ncbi:MAG: flagellar hook-length control protein FliK [Marinosulfonomonas sp.]|nr:flagellar hook-length control protein FliK [Marinosulfonomonas sp.]
MTLISGEVEKPVAEPVSNDDISASFLDVMTADIAVPENAVDGQGVVPVVARVLPQVLQAEGAVIPVVQNAPLPDGSIDQPAFAQYVEQRLPIMAKINLPTHSGTPDMQPEDTVRIPANPSVLPDNRVEAEKPILPVVQDPEVVPNKKVLIAPDDSAPVKSVISEPIQKNAPETAANLHHPRQIQVKPEAGLQSVGIELGKGQDAAPQQPQQIIARPAVAASTGTQTPLPIRDLPRPMLAGAAPKVKDVIVAPPQVNEARQAPAATPPAPALGTPFGLRPELPRAPEVLPTRIMPAPQTPKTSAPDAPSVEASFLNRPDRPQPAGAPMVSPPAPMHTATPVNHPQPTGTPLVQPRDPVLPAPTASQPFLTQAINSPAPFQPKEVKITPPQNVQIPTSAPNSAPSQPTLPDAPTPPLPAIETAPLEMVEPLETPDLFPVETRPTDSTGTRLDTITTRPEVARHVAQQLAEAARQMPDRPIELALNPEELGRVRLTFTMTDGGISVAVVVERGETMDLLRRHIDTLAQEFRDMGYKDVNFEFSRNGQGNTGDGDTNHDRSANSDTPSTETEGLAPVQLSLEPSIGLDLRL